MKSSTYRHNVVVHNSGARGYNSGAPSPSYGLPSRRDQNERHSGVPKEADISKDSKKTPVSVNSWFDNQSAGSASASTNNSRSDSATSRFSQSTYASSVCSRRPTSQHSYTSSQESVSSSDVTAFFAAVHTHRNRVDNGVYTETPVLLVDGADTGSIPSQPSLSLPQNHSISISSSHNRNSALGSVSVPLPHIDTRDSESPTSSGVFKEYQRDLIATFGPNPTFPSAVSWEVETKSIIDGSVFDEASTCASAPRPMQSQLAGRSKPEQPLSDFFNIAIRSASLSRLPCEFVGYSNCHSTFDPRDTELWIEHIVSEHLHGKMPLKCVCWFCDDFEFDVEKHAIDRYANYFRRMEHIREHVLEDHLSIHHIRPDYHFLEHLKNHNLISDVIYELARELDEGSDTTGTYNHDFVSPEIIATRERLQRVAIDENKENRQKVRSRRLRNPQILLDSKEVGNSNTKSSQNEVCETNSDVVLPCIHVPDQNPNKKIEARSAEPLNSQGRRADKPRSNGTSDVEKNRQHNEGGQRSMSSISWISALIQLSDTVATNPEHQTDVRPSVESSNSNRSCKHMGNNSRTNSGLSSQEFQLLADLGDDKEDCRTDSGPIAMADSLEHPQSSAMSICLSGSPSSETAETKLPPLRQRNQATIERLIESVTRLVQARVPNADGSSLGQSEGLGDHSGSSSNPQSFLWTGLNQKGHGGISKKRKTEETPEESESDGEGQDDPGVPSRKGKEKAIPKFACPYFKYDKSRYRDWRNCCGPGWPTVHRVK